MHKTLLAMFALIMSLSGQTFQQTCASPHFPGDATPIDGTCIVTGSSDPTKSDGLQNTAKNNFCAKDSSITVKVSNLKSLQKKTEKKEKSLQLTPGSPPPDRAFLTSLGEGDVVTFEGFVFLARQECKESVNCGVNSPNTDASHDIHINILDKRRKTIDSDPQAKRDAEECTGIVVEMIPHHRPLEWTACNVNDVAQQNLRVRITGQRMFDGSHIPCKGSQPQGSNPKRVSVWEIHPIYTFEVCPTGTCSQGGWVPLTTFAAGKTTCENKPCEN